MVYIDMDIGYIYTRQGHTNAKQTHSSIMQLAANSIVIHYVFKAKKGLNSSISVRTETSTRQTRPSKM